MHKETIFLECSVTNQMSVWQPLCKDSGPILEAEGGKIVRVRLPRGWWQTSASGTSQGQWTHKPASVMAACTRPAQGQANQTVAHELQLQLRTYWQLAFGRKSYFSKRVWPLVGWPHSSRSPIPIAIRTVHMGSMAYLKAKKIKS